MIMLKKQLFVASLFLCACWALRTSEGDGPGEAEQKTASAEVEQKEAVARNPQGQVVPFLGRMLTFGEAAGRVIRGQNPAAWSFARGLATGATVPLEKPIEVPLEQRIAQLPIDAQKNIASYLGSTIHYALWQELKTPATLIAFKDNGQNLVSVIPRSDNSVEVLIRSMSDGVINNRFTISMPVQSIENRGAYQFLLSADGTRIVGIQPRTDVANPFAAVYVWDTMNSTLLHTFDTPVTVGGKIVGASISSDGSLLMTRVRTGQRDGALVSNIETGQMNLLSNWYEAIDPVMSSNNKFIFAVVRSFNLSNSYEIGVIDRERSTNYLMPLHEKPEEISAMGSNADGKRIAFAMKEKIKIFSTGVDHLETSKLILERELTLPFKRSNNQTTIRSLLFSSDGKTLAAVVYKNALLEGVLLVDLETGNYIQEIPVRGFRCSVAFSPDNVTFAIAGSFPMRDMPAALAPTIQIWKKFTIQDALEKQHKIQEWRSQKAPQEGAQQQSQIPVSSESGTSSSSSNSTAVVQQPAVVIHTQEPAEEAGVKNLNMDEPD